MTRTILLLLFVPLSFVLIIPQLIAAAGIFFLGKNLKDKTLINFGFNWAYSLDQLGNTLWLGAPDETISSRTGRAIASGNPQWWVPAFGKLVDWLAWVFAKDDNHVLDSIEDDEDYSKEINSWIKK